MSLQFKTHIEKNVILWFVPPTLFFFLKVLKMVNLSPDSTGETQQSFFLKNKYHCVIFFLPIYQFVGEDKFNYLVEVRNFLTYLYFNRENLESRYQDRNPWISKYD